MITFVIGGAKSGKSRFCLERASRHQGQKLYIATAQALDDEMREKVERHKKERSGEWATLEEPLRIAASLKRAHHGYGAILIDCLTLWLSNLLLAQGKDIDSTMDEFVASLDECRTSNIFIVSNEVGLGIVPDSALSRRFRDLAGALNQKIAALADEVYLVTAGIPLKIK
ncbi:MAG: bifunctional adenosylcobinamide kinase/adenosylcobinamide-phosphate guanylyltransferase [Nitrospirota bacterium]